MAANYGRPKPVDPLSWLRGCYLRVSCGCGHSVVREVSGFAGALGLPGDMMAYQLIDRLRCSQCGARPIMAKVAGRRGG